MRISDIKPEVFAVSNCAFSPLYLIMVSVNLKFVVLTPIAELIYNF